MATALVTKIIVLGNGLTAADLTNGRQLSYSSGDFASTLPSLSFNTEAQAWVKVGATTMLDGVNYTVRHQGWFTGAAQVFHSGASTTTGTVAYWELSGASGTVSTLIALPDLGGTCGPCGSAGYYPNLVGIALTTRSDLDGSSIGEAAWNGAGSVVIGPSGPGRIARGTMIATERGAVAIEDLRAGGLVRTAGNGQQPVRWICSCTLPRPRQDLETDLEWELRPVRLRAGCLGDGLPEADLTVLPQHRMQVRSKIAERMFGVTHVLVPAENMLDIDGVEHVAGEEGLEYFHLLFDRHEIIFANGAATESLFTGRGLLETLPAELARSLPATPAHKTSAPAEIPVASPAEVIPFVRRRPKIETPLRR